jgi:hypothetical protein
VAANVDAFRVPEEMPSQAGGGMRVVAERACGGRSDRRVFVFADVLRSVTYCLKVAMYVEIFKDVFVS